MATPADSDDEFFESREAVDLTLGSGSRGDGGNGASASGGGGSGLGTSPRPLMVNESRSERGLASPTLRGSANASPSPWEEAR